MTSNVTYFALNRSELLGLGRGRARGGAWQEGARAGEGRAGGGRMTAFICFNCSEYVTR